MLQVALWTLGQVIESTAYVIEPYQKYPMLLDVLLTFLKTEQSASIRREVSAVGTLVTSRVLCSDVLVV